MQPMFLLSLTQVSSGPVRCIDFNQVQLGYAAYQREVMAQRQYVKAGILNGLGIYTTWRHEGTCCGHRWIYMLGKGGPGPPQNFFLNRFWVCLPSPPPKKKKAPSKFFLK